MVLKLSNPFLYLRSITTNDEECLFKIYSSTRSEELAQLTEWNYHYKEAFLRSQFAAQHNYYQNNYKGAHFWIIEYKSKIIGRLYLQTHFDGTSVRIIDITLLPEWRKRGIGKDMIKDIIQLALSINQSVTIHVESFNQAMNLYKRLGFELVSQTNGVYHLLEWKTKTLPIRNELPIKQLIECR